MSTIQEIQGTIRAQLIALSRGDPRAAFELTSSAIREQFSDAGAFGRTVQDSYPELCHARTVEFGHPSQIEDRIAQPTEVTSEEGVTLLTLFLMVAEGTGLWRIDGVLQLRTDMDAGYVN